MKTKTLQEIKDEVAREKTPHKWNDLQPSVVETMDLWPEVCRRAQLEACKATLERASENVKHRAETVMGMLESVTINKSSITSEENIVIIK